MNKGILLLHSVVNGLSSSKEKYLDGPDLVRLALKRNWAERLQVREGRWQGPQGKDLRVASRS